MRTAVLTCTALLVLGAALHAQEPFDTPLYINMGGPEVVDSLGRTWLGDQGAGLDPLNIRPEDSGGPNTIEDWCNPSPETIDALSADALSDAKFDSTHPGDTDLFRSIRWDDGSAAPDYTLEIPLAPGVYSISTYFCESCCTNRHARVLFQGNEVFSDVSVDSYAGGATHTPGVHSDFAAVGPDGILDITLLGCPPALCPGGGDVNPTMTALAIVQVEEDPCAREGLRVCPRGLECTIEDGAVTGTWSAPTCMEVAGYEVFENGEVIDTLPGDATSFVSTTEERTTTYTVRTLVVEGDAPCAEMTCVVNQEIGFKVPLYINLGGPEVVDSFGRTWQGDPGAGADPLNIRPDDAGGPNVIEAWCSPSQDSIAALLAETNLGVNFNPSHPGDTDIFRSIRWDLGANPPDYVLEIPVPPGSYTTSLYFCESCCPQRHEKVLIQGELAFADVSVESYAGGATHTPGIHTQNDVIVGDDGLLNVTLLGCLDPECPGGGDGNPTLTALAVVPSDYDPCADESFISCASGLSCTVDADGNVTGSWSAPACGAAEGYEVYRGDELLETLPGDATSFSAVATDRFTDFTVRTVGNAACVEQTCSVFRQDVAFDVPLRINMGGVETVDSMGRTWLGDGPGAGDPLGIRPNDAGGTNTAENWSSGAFQPVSFEKFGLDPDNAGDQYIFNTIRWDNGGDADDFIMAVPLPDGEYTVNLYFTEGCCIGRNFKIELQGAIVDDNVSYLDYDDFTDELGYTGLLSFPGIPVFNGVLQIGLLPCPECPRPMGTAADNNAIIDALELERTGDLPTVNQLVGDCNQDGAQDVSDIVCSVGQLFPGFPLIGRNPEAPCQTAAGTAVLLDINSDGAFDAADIASYADFLFGGAAGPPTECAAIVDLGCAAGANCQ